MTVKGGYRPACAACRFQRRRCSSDCPLAPYFPANQPKVFQNAHRLYGVGNIMKILNRLKDDEQKQEAMRSIIYESNMRQVYRVHGCYGIILNYHKLLVEATQELHYVRLLIDMYKKKAKQTQSSSYHVDNEINDQVLGESSYSWTNSMINGGNDLGFYYNGLSDHNVNVNEIPVQSRFDEFQLFNGEQGEGSPDYTDMVYDVKLESSLKDARYYVEHVESKVNEKLLEVQRGVNRMTIGLYN